MTIKQYQSLKPIRCWINQPSSLQPYHKFHGERGMAVFNGEEAVFAFLSGAVDQVMEIPVKCLELGWGKKINEPRFLKENS